MSLDKSNTEPPYLLGRLFATYERAQELAAGRELNRTIRDSYFGSAMGSPQSVYARLAQLNQVHMRELKRAAPRAAVYFDKLLLEISDKMSPEKAYPARATPAAQGVFTLGYYHQRHDFFEKPGRKIAPTFPTEGVN